jgi:glycosyltransferase involved in cell wall biosynthesis
VHRTLRDTYSVPAERLAVVPQAVADTYVVDAAPVDPVRLGRLLYVGQYAFFKAPIVLSEAIGKLLELHPQLRFTWVCSKAHHSEIGGQIPPHLMNRVQLLDWMPQHELVRVYDEHGVFLFPSFFEGFGKAFLEAMSRGLVVVAADNGGMRDVISDQVDGYKVPTGDIEAMVDCVSYVIQDAERSLTVSMNAIKTASKLTWDRHAEESTGFYRRLIELDRVRRAARGG